MSCQGNIQIKLFCPWCVDLIPRFEEMPSFKDIFLTKILTVIFSKGEKKPMIAALNIRFPLDL